MKILSYEFNMNTAWGGAAVGRWSGIESGFRARRYGRIKNTHTEDIGGTAMRQDMIVILDLGSEENPRLGPRDPRAGGSTVRSIPTTSRWRISRRFPM